MSKQDASLTEKAKNAENTGKTLYDDRIENHKKQIASNETLLKSYALKKKEADDNVKNGYKPKTNRELSNKMAKEIKKVRKNHCRP